ncbi:MAG: hypothetical protein AAGJ84_07165 [Pseudomonadota bacterium]
MHSLRCLAVSCLGAIALSGCATVSMVSGQAMVETGLIKEASSVEQVCDAYVAKAEAEAWIRPSPGLFGFARTLLNGDSDSESAETSPYLERIGAGTADTALLLKTITQDLGRARSGLEIVTQEASQSLEAPDQDEDLLKLHVISFESALIAAQKSRRTFITAFEFVSDRGETLDSTEFDAALIEFDLAIDTARKTADRLATAYSSLAVNGDTSSATANKV